MLSGHLGLLRQCAKFGAVILRDAASHVNGRNCFWEESMKCLSWFLIFLDLFTLFSEDLIMQMRLSQRENLKFLVARGENATQSWLQLQSVYGEECMSCTQVQFWHKRFREGDGHTPVTDLLHSGRPHNVRTPEAVQKVNTIVRVDRRKSCAQMGEEAGVSRATAHRIMNDLGLKKKAPKFVPRLLSDEQKRMRMKICASNLKLLADVPELLDYVVTGDESSIPLYDPETKLSSMHWLAKEDQHPQKALCTCAHSSTMVMTFFDSSGLILIEFLPKGETITAET